ncbi:hypothetical protein BO79DRAFT_232615 [Aspergillus costaricaensis CBS 115574]|uniref:Uncharacterized protein n=1 Tax=Aspergillus costaricaensis CBS 115574 TaxID=1448317 RepID=A0ACD1I166_9EURO|nr:hypothetical protein BO79DRAFT_232615 [Aspergillus costaricaensis CBS 115574]RAK84234.1 hypothetical protein BO79DRAFT_232615 [Aspergillus costaricaensis CBS 115574]
MPTTNAIAFSCKVQGHVYRCALSIGSFRGNPSQRWMRVCSGLAVRRTPPRFSRMGLAHRPGSLFMVSFGGLHAMTLHHGTSASEFSLLSPPRSLDELNHSLNEDLAGITPFWSSTEVRSVRGYTTCSLWLTPYLPSAQVDAIHFLPPFLHKSIYSMTNGGPIVSDIVAQLICSICLDRLRIATTALKPRGDWSFEHDCVAKSMLGGISMAVFDNNFLVHSHYPRHDAQQLPCEPTLAVSVSAGFQPYNTGYQHPRT